ncbi:hypothetical protein D9619_003827 [Psilocybe cf. subviscida]|uniref:Uncharacterized protein n=1 Tax=Psilocybe cf. subviscida TaxID=2480587 RepID=A0A8H5AW65_9AGAR|nr:hypothetical protein D9619_003827 [Psilocybe cf. subviscida]
MALHAPISSCDLSGYSSLAAALPPAPGSIPGVFRLPQTIYNKGSSGRPLAVPIRLDLKCQGGAGSGVAMRDLCARSVQGLITVLQGGEDLVARMVPGGRITFRILWPGYSHLPSTYSIDISADPSMSLARLGQTIAQAFARFIEAYRHTPSGHPQFSVALGGIRLEHLFLLSIQNTCDGNWQADVVVDMRA